LASRSTFLSRFVSASICSSLSAPPLRNGEGDRERKRKREKERDKIIHNIYINSKEVEKVTEKCVQESMNEAKEEGHFFFRTRTSRLSIFTIPEKFTKETLV